MLGEGRQSASNREQTAGGGSAGGRIRRPPDPGGCWPSSPRPSGSKADHGSSARPGSMPHPLKRRHFFAAALALRQMPRVHHRAKASEIAARVQRQGLLDSGVSSFTAFFFPCTGGTWCARWQCATAPWPWSSSSRWATSSAGRPSTSRSISAARSRGLNRRKPSSRYSRCSTAADLFGAFRMALRGILDFAKRGPPAAPQEIDGRIGGDPRQPVRRLLFVLELFLVLQRLDEGLLGEVLGVRDVPHNPVNLHENPA